MKQLKRKWIDPDHFIKGGKVYEMTSDCKVVLWGKVLPDGTIREVKK